MMYDNTGTMRTKNDATKLFQEQFTASIDSESLRTSLLGETSLITRTDDMGVFTLFIVAACNPPSLFQFLSAIADGSITYSKSMQLTTKNPYSRNPHLPCSSIGFKEC
jgi:hypothetical protein